jgi:regulator of sigma E protease
MEAIPVGLTKGKDQLVIQTIIKMIFSPAVPTNKWWVQSDFDIFPSTWSWETFLRITALLSIMLE